MNCEGSEASSVGYFILFRVTLLYNSSSESSISMSCHVCTKGPVGTAHRCKKCLKYVHVFCGIISSEDEEGYGQPVTCNTCNETAKSM